ncbi:MAG: hypothetical protein EOO16_04960 [Chitinophagaceae bacterium]|nr:MAG: hypothetical protein EOO16_04960 [Chitinophagaceae bacterium]
MRLPLLTILTILFLPGRAQLTEAFADSNFTAAPAWSGTPGAWTVNAALQLQSTHPLPNSSFYLATPLPLAGDLQWELWLRLAFGTSSANYTDVWLLSASADPAAPGNTGYFVRIGGTQDEVALYRKDPAAAVKIIDGADGLTAGSDNQLRIRVTRTGAQFRLQRAAAMGSFITEGTATDAAYASGSWFALQARQSTSSFFGKHFFDDIRILPFVADTDAPRILSVRALSDTTADLRFNEPVLPADAAVAASYRIGGETALAAATDPADPALVHLRFATRFPQGQTILLTAVNMHDEWGNLLLRDTGSFIWYTARRGDVLLHEFMADPEPSAGLPATEWVELRNVCPYPVALQGWHFSAGGDRSAPLPDILLAPDSFLLLAPASAAARLLSYGAVAGLAPFPSIDNSGDTLALLSAEGKVIHAVAWDRSWYRNNIKEEGGWSLELVDARNACGGAGNWKASANTQGGTPGHPNSVAAINPDTDPPSLLRTWMIDSLQLVAVFNEPLDSSTAAAATYTLSNGIAITEAVPVGPLFVEVRLLLSRPLEAGDVSRLTVDGASDCSGNAVGPHNSAGVGMPVAPAAGKVVINEILYQPNTGGAEWVELYNYGTAPIDLSQCLLAGRNSSGVLTNAKRLRARPWLLFPGAYAVLTGDAAAVVQQYAVARPDGLLEQAGLPALPDDGGAVVLLDAAGNVLDEVRYDPDWHYPLLHEPRGVSLERISATAPAQDPHNWHSAAQPAGYATPTARNSQHRDGGGGDGIEINPRVFSPDGDGMDDLVFVEYALEENGYMANVHLYDAGGRLLRRLVRNALMGRSGRWHWDGTDENGRAAVPGVYIALIELFRPDGKREVVKKSFALVRRE